MIRRRKKISQREARLLRKRVAYLERMAKMFVPTPYPRWEVCRFTMTDAMDREVRAAHQFGAVLRAERSGSLIQVFAYKPEVTP